MWVLAHHSVLRVDPRCFRYQPRHYDPAVTLIAGSQSGELIAPRCDGIVDWLIRSTIDHALTIVVFGVVQHLAARSSCLIIGEASPCCCTVLRPSPDSVTRRQGAASTLDGGTGVAAATACARTQACCPSRGTAGTSSPDVARWRHVGLPEPRALLQPPPCSPFTTRHRGCFTAEVRMYRNGRHGPRIYGPAARERGECSSHDQPPQRHPSKVRGVRSTRVPCGA